MTHWPLYAGFIALVGSLITLDLCVLNRKAHVISTKEALGWTLLWASLAVAFMGAIYWIYNHHWLGMGEGMLQPNGMPVVNPGKDAAPGPLPLSGMNLPVTELQ